RGNLGIGPTVRTRQNDPRTLRQRLGGLAPARPLHQCRPLVLGQLHSNRLRTSHPPTIPPTNLRLTTLGSRCIFLAESTVARRAATGHGSWLTTLLGLGRLVD